ncbi:MAG: hypothetical protein KF729_22780 [Sandaracinaceae bacterium]|nr:hypothetical protein [Sandaracinaceae bacterium]
MILASALTSCALIAPFQLPTETSAERCANGLDDDLDGLVDCTDPDCDGYCPEQSAAACGNGRDDDGDGLVDAEDVECWPHATVRVEGRAVRCSSRQASASQLARGDSSWLLSLPCGDDCPPGTPWSHDGASFLRLGASVACRGAGVLTDDCPSAWMNEPLTGGGCWHIEADVELDPGAELVIVIAPELATPPLRGRSASLLVRLGRAAEGVRLTYTADGGSAEAGMLPAGERGVHLVLEASAANCATATRSSVSMSATDLASGTPVSLDALALPTAWAPDEALFAAIQSTADAEVRVHRLALAREGFDPCGYPVPQITGSRDGPAAVYAAARGDGVVCVIGATEDGDEVERVYDPVVHDGWPPELGPDDPPAPARRFAAWRTEDRGLASFMGSPLDRPARASRLDHARAGALSFRPGVGFEGVILASDDDGADHLARIASRDCVDWQVEPLTLEGFPADAHPLRYDAGQLVLGIPGDGIAAGAGIDFVAPADRAPRIKPLRSECMFYPRARLVGVELDDSAMLRELGPIPAIGLRWLTNCGPLSSGSFLSERAYPAVITQFIERGGDRAFVTSGRLGVEVVIDGNPVLSRSDGPAVATAALLANPLVEPTGEPGTFDAARVSEGYLLIMDGEPRRCPGALLFYRGHAEVDVDAAQGLAFPRSGRVGVVPIRLGPPPSASVPVDAACLGAVRP